MNIQQLTQLRKSWISNVVTVQNLTEEKATEMYDKIQPYDVAVYVEKTDTGLSAYGAHYPVFTTADNGKKLLDNIIQAFNFYFKETGSGAIIGPEKLLIINR